MNMYLIVEKLPLDKKSLKLEQRRNKQNNNLYYVGLDEVRNLKW